MLRFVFGRNSSGKTEYVRQYIAEKIKKENREFILIVPEQFSFDTERAMLHAIGAKDMLSLEILSFSRLAETVLMQYKPQLKVKIDDGTRAVLMSRAIEGLDEEADLYRKFMDKPQLLTSLVTFSTELKQCAVTTDALQKAGASLEPSVLKDKLSELIKITDLYNALVQSHFSDDTDLLDRLADFIPETEFFHGKTVVIDAFDGFTKQERRVISLLLSRCEDVIITLCLDEDIINRVPCVFDNIYKEYESLKRAAAEVGVGVKKPLILPNTRLKKAEALSFLEENVYKINPEVYTEQSNVPVYVFSGQNPADECEYVARTIHRLLREEQYKAKDIAVVERRKDKYDSDLHAAFEKYSLPFFEDKRQPVRQQPLMRYVTSLLDMAADGISTENLMRFLKTELTDLSAKEIAGLESYATVWDIDYSKWAMPFTGNPDGLGVSMHERSQKKLEHLNTLREKAVGPILAFKKMFSEATGAEKSKMLFSFLKKNEVDEHLKTLAVNLKNCGFQELSEQQNTVWEILMQFLDSLFSALGDETVTPKRYRELFSILLDSVNLGQIPQGLDMITVGAIDRMRIAPPKAVFIIGANDGVFPENPPTEGILNDTERKTLEALGIELTETAEFKTVDERSFVYNALSLPTQKLFVSYSTADFKGNSMTESELVREIQKILPTVSVTDSNTVPYEEHTECAPSAFETMALLYHENTELSATLKAYFENEPTYAARTAAVKQAAQQENMKFQNQEVSQKLFGKDMLISASKAEVYYKCPFSYFCKFGLQLRPLKKAEIDFAQSGTLMHYILEVILRDYSLEALSSMSDTELKEKIEALIALYIEEKMGGKEDKDARFIYLLSDLSKTVFDVLKRLLEESKVCDFVPTDFELSIAPDGPIDPYKLALENGGSLQVIGSVDRVDLMQKADKTYFRIIDYKSGGKTFRLSDVFGGLNMQMLIYLFAIAENGEEHYGKAIPAGVLYLPAKAVTDDLNRDAQEKDIREAKLKNSRMDGVILENTDVILGMDKEVTGAFVRVTQSGEQFKGSLLNQKAFAYLKDRVDGNLVSMAENLQKGAIPVLPTHLNTTNVACKYCDFKSICGFEEGDAIKTLDSTSSFDKAKAELMKGENEA